MRTLKYVLLSIVLAVNNMLICHATPVQTLVENGTYYDGRSVVIQGEVIGDVLQRGMNAWLNVLSQEGVAIGVLCSMNDTRGIKMVGNYKQHGDTVLVNGVFHRFYKEQGGETAIVADSVLVTAPGYLTPEKISPFRAAFGMFCLMLGLGMWAVYQFFIKKR